MFITVFPELQIIFAAWFTFDSVPPDGDAMTTFGAPDQRWVTGAGKIEGTHANLAMELTSGGVFNAAEPLPIQEPGYGTMTLEFKNCTEGTVTYNFPAPGESGEFTINRVVDSNIALCEALQSP